MLQNRYRRKFRVCDYTLIILACEGPCVLLKHFITKYANHHEIIPLLSSTNVCVNSIDISEDMKRIECMIVL